MDSNGVSGCACPAEREGLRVELATLDPAAGGGLRLSERASLLAVLLLSLGLWAAIWGVITALVSRAPG